MKVFIGYSRKDHNLLTQITKPLENSRISYFYDAIIDKGDIFQERIRNEILNCNIFFFLITPNSLKSEWIKFEFSAAWILSKRAVPILHDCSNDDLPYLFRDYQSEKLSNIDQFIFELKEKRTELSSCYNKVQSYPELISYYQLVKQTGYLNKNLFRVSESFVIDFWKDCILRTNNIWNAIAYTRGEETWERGFKDKLIKIAQIERILSGCSIQRIFLIDSDEEYNKILPVSEEQERIGISVTILKKEQLLNINFKNYFKITPYQYIQKNDFAIVDQEWVFKIELDENRNYKSASITNDLNEYNFASEILYELRKLPEYRVEKTKDNKTLNNIKIKSNVIDILAEHDISIPSN